MPENQNHKFSYLNILVIVLSVYVLAALLADNFFILPPEISKLINYFDFLICIFFLAEFFLNLKRAPDKRQFMRWGWIDLVASIPMLDALRAGRILRLIRLLRVVRAFIGTQELLRHIYRNKAKAAVTIVSLVGFLLIIFCSIAILQAEQDPASNIRSAEDSIWWVFCTITTVGYGDKFPVTAAGKLIGMVLMVAGVGLFGVFTAYIASWFVVDEQIHHDEN